MRKFQLPKLQMFGALALVLAACSPHAADGKTAAAATAATHPVSGLQVIPVSVRAGHKRLTFRSEVARTREEQSRGLMFRTAMGDGEGMIFLFDAPRNSAFWMKNTVIPLDIIFIGTDNRILNVAANAVPYSEQALPSAGVAKAVLEINGGRAAKLGIKAGDRVEW